MSVKFVIVSAPRTGSTLLVRTLNSLDGVCCHGELLDGPMVRGYVDGFDPASADKSERDERATRLVQARDKDPVAFIQAALRSDNTVTGFKALYHALLDPRWREVTASLLAPGNIKFIHLTRGNSLRRYVSEQILQEGGPIHSQAGGRSEQRIKVHVDIDGFVQRNLELKAEALQLADLLGEQTVLELSYEELANDTGAATARVCEFFGLDISAAQIEPALQKVGAADLSDSVTNFQELLDNDATRLLALAD